MPIQSNPFSSNARAWLRYTDCGVRTCAGAGEPLAVNWLALYPRSVSGLAVVTHSVPCVSNLRSNISAAGLAVYTLRSTLGARTEPFAEAICDGVYSYTCPVSGGALPVAPAASHRLPDWSNVIP